MSLNRNYKLNLKLWGGLFALTAGGVFLGSITVLFTLDRIEQARHNSIAESTQLANAQRALRQKTAEIEGKAEIQQTYIENKINTFNSLTIENYTCDPNVPPALDWSLYVQNHKVLVADRNQRTIGELMPSGIFYFHSENCK